MDFNNPVLAIIAEPLIACIVLCTVIILISGTKINSHLKFKKFTPEAYKGTPDTEEPQIEDFEESAFS